MVTARVHTLQQLYQRRSRPTPAGRGRSSTATPIEKKEDMRRRGVASPDGWDAVVWKFAEPVVSRVLN